MRAARRQGLILLILLISGMIAYSQSVIKWIDIGVNGLTCSLCTRSVEMSVVKLPFVDSVVMDLEKTQGRVYLKKNIGVELKKIAKAVVNAGFSVRFLTAVFDFDALPVGADGSFSYQGQDYQWMQFNKSLAKGQVELKLVDSDFLQGQESAEWKKKIKSLDQAHQSVLHVVQNL